MDNDYAHDHARAGRRRLLVASILSTLAILIAFSVVAYEVIQRRNATEQEAREDAFERELLCQSENNSRNAVREILKLAQSVADRDTQEERDAARDFYTRALALVHPVDCERFIGADDPEDP